MVDDDMDSLMHPGRVEVRQPDVYEELSNMRRLFFIAIGMLEAVKPELADRLRAMEKEGLE